MIDLVTHASDCATHNEPALPAGECDCPANDLETLVAACEEAFGAEGDWDDNEDVSSPGSGITFGMIRRARAALAGTSRWDKMTPERRQAALCSIIRTTSYPQEMRRGALAKLVEEFGDESGCCDEFPECSHVLSALGMETS